MLDTSRKKLIPAGLLALFLLYYLRPYHGIRHDAALYLGQALLRLDPGNLSSDLFFTYGSQANFTVFPHLVASLLRHFDAASVFLVLTFASLAFFLVASACLLTRLFAAPQWYWGLLALLILPGGYGGFSTFTYAEPFFSGRSLAEPLVLLALAAYFWGRWPLAAALWITAAALHPLQALPAALLWWCDRIYRDQRWLHMLWLPALLLMAGALGAPYSEKWMTRFDAQWLGWVQETNRLVFISIWTAQDWAFLTTDVFLVTLLFRHASGPLQALARALLFATALGFTCSLVFADLLGMVLPTGLQLWRIQWLLHWLAMASVPLLLYMNYKRDGAWGVRGWLLLAAVALGVPSSATGLSAFAIWILVPLYVFWPALAPKVSPTIRRLILVAIPLALGILLVKHGIQTASRFTQLGGLREALRPEFVILAHPLVAGALVAAALRLYGLHGRWRSILLLLLIPMFAHVAAQWDRRSIWTSYVESARYEPKLFGFELEPGAQVFWAEELVAPWLILHRPSYFSQFQTAGILFNRRTAEEAVKRKDAMTLLEFQLSTCRLMNALNKSEESCLIDISAITDACAKSAGGLDYLVLDNAFKDRVLGSWEIKGGLKGDRPITYNLYRCKDFKTELAEPGAK